MKRRIIVTGVAGFIGSTLAEQLVSLGDSVLGIDNFDPYYDMGIKLRNLKLLNTHHLFEFAEIDICDFENLKQHISGKYEAIIHIAAKAGVRNSVIDPVGCQKVNVMGTQNMLEIAKDCGIPQFVFASSSSVYGINSEIPWKESNQDMRPISPYASTKVSCELLGHVYAHLYDIRFLAMRLFSVYGPRQRPDLAIHKFAHKIRDGIAIPVYGDGSSRRDYTYVGDVVKALIASLDFTESNFEIFNIGNNDTLSLSEMIETIEDVFQKKAIIDRLPEQPGDVPVTYADISKAKKYLNYKPSTTFKEGILKFKEWMESI